MAQDATPLLTLLQPYVEHDPAIAAHNLEAMTEEEATEVLEGLPPGLSARIFPYLQVSYAAALLRDAEPALIHSVVRTLDPKRATALFMHLQPEARERFLPHLPDRLKWEIGEQLSYPEDSVGRIMVTRFPSFKRHLKVRDVLRRLRSRSKEELPDSYIYILGEEERLVGVMNMHDLIRASPEAPLGSVMRTEVFALHYFTEQEEAARELAKRRYFAAPVVDNEHRMLGVIKAEQLIPGLQEEATEDLQKMVGAGQDERAFSTLGFSLRKRLPWLHVNLLTAFLAAGVVALFEDLIARITVLAIFLPVVAGQGGNAGAQSLAIVMRGLVMREIPQRKRGYLVFKESLLGTINGVVTGALTALVAWLWSGNAVLGLVVGLGMVVNLFFAGLAGAAIPLVMKALQLDPAQCSSIILTTVTDVIGFFAFLGFALLFQAYLI